jgi:hypothetical protein
MASSEPVSARAMVAKAAERLTGNTKGSRVMSNACSGLFFEAALIPGISPSARNESSTLGNVSGKLAWAAWFFKNRRAMF